jgi:hypothetical protein
MLEPVLSTAHSALPLDLAGLHLSVRFHSGVLGWFTRISCHI